MIEAPGLSSPLYGESMGYGYPIVLRQKAVEAYKAGHGSIEEISILFGVWLGNSQALVVAKAWS